MRRTTPESKSLHVVELHPDGSPVSEHVWTFPSPQDEQVQVDLVLVDQALLGKRVRELPLPCMKRSPSTSSFTFGIESSSSPSSSVAFHSRSPDYDRHQGLLGVPALATTRTISRRAEGGPAVHAIFAPYALVRRHMPQCQCQAALARGSSVDMRPCPRGNERVTHEQPAGARLDRDPHAAPSEASDPGPHRRRRRIDPSPAHLPGFGVQRSKSDLPAKKSTLTALDIPPGGGRSPH